MKDVKSIIDSLASPTPSKWREKAQWRRDNRAWLRKSQKIAVSIIEAMKASGLSQKELAEKMSVSPQYISKILKGSENLSLETISKFETVLGIELCEIKTNVTAQSTIVNYKIIIAPNFSNTYKSADLVNPYMEYQTSNNLSTFA